jgi:hypothetical protein
MKMSNEIHWMFESKGEPEATATGQGAPKAMIAELIQWIAGVTMHRRMVITIAKTAEELIDKRTQGKANEVNEMQTDMDALFAQVMAQEGVE